MSCVNCSQTITEVLEDLNGVTEANINFATDEGSVEYDPDEVSLAEIYDAIESAGYEPQRSTVSIGISDMTCANCAETNKDAPERVPGVISAGANYATDEAQVDYNPADVSRDALYDAIENAGYTPVRDDDSDEASDQERQDAARHAEIRKQLRLTLFGAALSAPLLFFLVEKYLLGGGIVPETIFGVEFSWVEFLLATPVQFVPAFRKCWWNVGGEMPGESVAVASGGRSRYPNTVEISLRFQLARYKWNQPKLVLRTTW